MYTPIKQGYIYTETRGILCIKNALSIYTRANVNSYKKEHFVFK